MIRRLIWHLAYVRIALASRYEISPREAWQDAASAWKEQADETPEGEKMVSPAEAFRLNEIEWRLQW